MNLDDKSLFLDAMEDVQPLKRATDVHWHPTRNQRAPQRISRWSFGGKGCNMGCWISCAVVNIRNRRA